MTYINSNKNSIIIQPITLQIRAPFQFLINQIAIKRKHYSESRDGLNGCCSFSVVCAAREYTPLDCFIQRKGCKVEQSLFHLFFPTSLPLFQVQKSTRSLHRHVCIEYSSSLTCLMLKEGEIDL